MQSRIEIASYLTIINKEIKTLYRAADLLLINIDRLVEKLEEILKQDMDVCPVTINQLFHYLTLVDDTIVQIKSDAIKVEQEIREMALRLGCCGEHGKEKL